MSCELVVTPDSQAQASFIWRNRETQMELAGANSIKLICNFDGFKQTFSAPSQRVQALAQTRA